MRTIVRGLAFVIVVVLIPVCSDAQTTGPLRIFIGAATRGGFVETSKDIQDSIKDLTKKVKDIKGVALVSSRSEANLRIIVTGRGAGSEYFGQRLSFTESYAGAEITSMPISQNTWWVATILEVGGSDYRKEFVGAYTHPAGMAYYGGAWTECASQLSKNLKAWIEANAEQLRTRP